MDIRWKEKCEEDLSGVWKPSFVVSQV